MESTIIKGLEFVKLRDHAVKIDNNGLLTFEYSWGYIKRVLYTDNTGKTFYMDCRGDNLLIGVSVQVRYSKKFGLVYRVLEESTLFLSTTKGLMCLSKRP